MKKLLSVFLVLILMTLLTCTACLGETRATKVLTGKKGAALRDSPDGAKLTGIHANTYLDVYDETDKWYKVNYNGTIGWVYKDQVTVTETITVQPDTKSTATPKPIRREDIPYLGNRVCKYDSHDEAVRWVQAQLKATDRWYQGNEWNVTGHLGKHTMSEIQDFMKYMGDSTHTGVVDQSVIDAICAYYDGDPPVLTGAGNKPSPSPTKKPFNPKNTTEDTPNCSICGGKTKKTVSTSYGQYDDKQHMYGPVEAYECMSCHETIFYGGDTVYYEDHTFQNGVCTKCGYKKGTGRKCDACGETMILEEYIDDVPYDDYKHSSKRYQFYECKNCYNRTQPVLVDSQLNSHVFDSSGVNCIYCGYHDYGD